MEIYDLIKQAMAIAEKENLRPAMEANQPYMLIYTEDHMASNLLFAESQEFELVNYYAETTNIKNGLDELVFMDIHNQPVVVRPKEYGSRWVAVRINTPLGVMMKDVYDKMMYYIHNQMPPELKGRVKPK